MKRVAVRRINEWDGPAMLKIYAPYVGTHRAPEAELPELQSYIQRIDKYTYGLGWIMCEIDSEPAGFCHLTEDRNDPTNLFSVELQMYVKPKFLRRGVGTSLWALIKDMTELGSRRKITVYIHRDNAEALAFFRSKGFKETGENGEETVMEYILTPSDETAERPTKPYLLESLDYERAREKAALEVKDTDEECSR